MATCSGEYECGEINEDINQYESWIGQLDEELDHIAEHHQSQQDKSHKDHFEFTKKLMAYNQGLLVELSDQNGIDGSSIMDAFSKILSKFDTEQLYTIVMCTDNKRFRLFVHTKINGNWNESLLLLKYCITGVISTFACSYKTIRPVYNAKLMIETLIELTPNHIVAIYGDDVLARFICNPVILQNPHDSNPAYGIVPRRPYIGKMSSGYLYQSDM